MSQNANTPCCSEYAGQDLPLERRPITPKLAHFEGSG